MTRRSPSETIVVDANIILSGVLGSRSGFHIERVSKAARLVISQDAANESANIIERLTKLGVERRELFESFLAEIDVVGEATYQGGLHDAALTLRNAVASRNGSVADAHVLALAWVLDADIWSHDRDFAGTGWPSWSSANLLAALGDDAPPAEH